MSSPANSTAVLPHDSVQPNLVACAVVTWLIGLAFVVLRFYTRRFIINVLGVSDWLILASLV